MKEKADENLTGKTPEAAGSIRHWAFSYKPVESRISSVLRSWLRIFFIIAHEFKETAISLRAAALTYSIVLSMVPILAMSTAVLKGLGSDNQLRLAAYKFIDQFEPEQQPSMQVEKKTGQVETTEGKKEAAELPSSPDATGAVIDSGTGNSGEQSASVSITNHLRNAVDTIFEYVDRTNFAALGAFGIVGLLLTVILVLSTVEDAMNAIWHTREGRSVLRKTMDYLALLILLPISINVALAGDAVLQSPTIMAHINAIIPAEWAITMLLKFLPFLFIILTLMVMYIFIPNIKVKTHAAFIGAVFAGFFWFLVQKAYIILQVGVAKYNAIYGSFATVPLFLIWVDIGWTFILLGASLAYAVQNRNLYHLPGESISPQRSLQLAFDILDTIYKHFSVKKQTSFDDLISENRGELPGDIQDITAKLLRGGLIHQVGDGLAYVPAAPSEEIEAREVVQLILGHEKIPSIGGEFSHQVILAAEEAIPPDAFPLPAGKKILENINNRTHTMNHGKDEKTL